MRGLSSCACALLAVGLLSGGALAQEPPALSDVPPGNATVRGIVLHTDRTDAALADIEVVLYALAEGGQAGVRRTTTDAKGAFRFENVAGEPGIAYLVGARYADLPFPGDRVVFGEGDGDGERVVEIRVSEPTADASRVSVEQSSLRIEWLGDRLAIGEVHRLRNAGTSVYHVAPGNRGGRAPALHAELPADATGFAMPLGMIPEGVERTGRDFRFFGPLYPGSQDISFRYEIPVPSGLVGLEKRFPSAAARVRVFGRENGPLQGAEGLEARGIVEDEGMRFQPFEREAAPAGFATILRLDVPESTTDPEAASLVESQMVLELDDVALSVREQHQLEVGGRAARSEDGAPILSIDLPANAEDVRFSGDAAALGLVRTDDGVGLLGPLTPGSHAVGLAYTLRVREGEVAFSRAFDRRLPLLRTYVADTGVAVETNRMHRRRPVRDADRTYQLFEAYEIDAQEELRFSLTPLPPRATSRTPALLLALAAGVAVAIFLARPLGGAAEALGDDGDEADPHGARREREALYETIHDLDHDHETGKLETGDWERLRAELRAQAVALLAEERRHEKPADVPRAAVPSQGTACPACGAETTADARFCVQCGAALSETGAA